MAYLPSLKAGIIGFENSFLKFRHILSISYILSRCATAEIQC